LHLRYRSDSNPVSPILVDSGITAGTPSFPAQERIDIEEIDMYIGLGTIVLIIILILIFT
jgi:hypothetical protein